MDTCLIKGCKHRMFFLINHYCFFTSKQKLIDIVFTRTINKFLTGHFQLYFYIFVRSDTLIVEDKIRSLRSVVEGIVPMSMFVVLFGYHNWRQQ